MTEHRLRCSFHIACMVMEPPVTYANARPDGSPTGHWQYCERRSATAQRTTADMLGARRIDALGHAVTLLELQGAQTLVERVELGLGQV